jgi:hypothetical protein
MRPKEAIVSDETLPKTDVPDSFNPADDEAGGNVIPDDYVAVFDPPDFEVGEIVCATLTSAGIHALMVHPARGPASTALPFLGNTWSHTIFVAPEDVEAARALLAASPPSEEELAAAQAADTTTLEEAERKARNA